VVITPDGRFLYLTMQEAGDDGDVLGYRIGSHGELTPVSGGRVEARALRPVQTVPSQGLFPSYQGVTVRPRD
jgi:hypothetical protein